MQKRRLEQIDQYQRTADGALQVAEKYAAWNDPVMARLHRNLVVSVNKIKYELIRREEQLAASKEKRARDALSKQRALDALLKARRVHDIEDAVFEDVA